MTDSVFDTSKYVQLGIDATRAGKKTEAREYLKFALKQSPNHIQALFWMAFVAPSPQESITLLERILALDPGNTRAKDGLRWAEQQAAYAEAVRLAEATESPDEVIDEADDDTSQLSRDDFLSQQDIKDRAHKGAMAHRARRNINPFLAVWLLLGAAAMIVTGIWAVAFVPPETLAAWLPQTEMMSVSPDADAAAVALHPETEAADEPALVAEKSTVTKSTVPANEAVNFTRQADTLVIESAAKKIPAVTEGAAVLPIEPVAPEVNRLTVPDITTAMRREPAPVANEAINIAPTPLDLFGPVGEAVSGFKLNEPVDESRLAHQPASADEKWIEVDVTRQMVIAWEGNIPVMAFLSSTGLPGTPTVLGNYNIYWKLEATLMTGPGYYLPDVPYTMYFYGGYALHGAYWHDNFGQPMSHGCVNLQNDNAKKLFEWADPVIPEGQTQVTATTANPGTLVVVHQ